MKFCLLMSRYQQLDTVLWPFLRFNDDDDDDDNHICQARYTKLLRHWSQNDTQSQITMAIKNVFRHLLNQIYSLPASASGATKMS